MVISDIQLKRASGAHIKYQNLPACYDNRLRTGSVFVGHRRPCTRGDDIQTVFFKKISCLISFDNGLKEVIYNSIRWIAEKNDQRKAYQ